MGIGQPPWSKQKFTTDRSPKSCRSMVYRYIRWTVMGIAFEHSCKHLDSSKHSYRIQGIYDLDITSATSSNSCTELCILDREASHHESNGRPASLQHSMGVSVDGVDCIVL